MGDGRDRIIMAIEERISVLLDIMHDYVNVEIDGLPHPKHSRAYAEWTILKNASYELQCLNRVDSYVKNGFKVLE